MKPLSAGSEIDAWCTRCRLDLIHRIVAMVDKRPKRVICTTCGSEHNYREPKNAPVGVKVKRKATETPARTSSARTKAEHRVVDYIQDWESKIAGHTVDSFRRYTVTLVLQQGQLLMHAKFGEGYVKEVLDGNKAIVLFREGAKTLAHSLKA